MAEEFGKLPEEIKRHIRFNFQHIWQDNPEEVDMEARLEELKKVFKEEGFPVDTDRIYHRHRCYADCENCVVINYDGNVFSYL